MADLLPGNSLFPGTTLTSPLGAFQLTFTEDGNLVLQALDDSQLPAVVYDEIVWRNPFIDLGHSGMICTMQTDGNLVIYDDLERPIFQSGSSGHEGENAFLRVQDDGNLVIYSSTTGAALWESGTAAQE
jgi:hypothetical protein